ncbi:universal stress protein [Gordonia sp. HNM0687]|uniref:Universal stress protein n=1 Tax=Gordonia mangrovi TaxID=2665643 RepID=A0A6L7GJL7_9ACTN|nr:universal stress protein [Gordonia mangrovi]MXP20129.1 universal stress protein [Gordonia mangrovi]UVF79262.1 universal stress protein [Gordonia mangrovi]
MTVRDGSIVVAVDGSDNALVATRWAAIAAERENLPLDVVCAFENPPVVPTQAFLDGLRDEARERVDEAAALAEKVAPGLNVAASIVEARPALLLRALSSRAHYLVVGSRGRGGVTGLLLGSVSTYVVAHGDCPVVVVPPAETAEPPAGAVVVGLDGSQVAHKAAVEAFRQAQLLKTSLVAVHTYSALSGEVIGGRHMPPRQQLHDEAVELVTAQLGDLREQYPDVNVDTVLSVDKPAQSILDQAKDAPLVVLGNRGRGGFRGLLLGSTCQSVLHVAPCPVMVVHTQ